MKFGTKKLLYLAFILLTLAVVLYIGVKNGDLPASLKAIMGIPPIYAVLCLGCTFGHLVLEALSNRSALKKLGYPMSFKRLYGICLLGKFYSYITPGASGGQPMQVYQFYRDRTPVGVATAALTIHFHAYQFSLLAFDVVFYCLYHGFAVGHIGTNLPFLVFGFLFNLMLLVGSLMIAFYQRPIRFLLKKLGGLLRRFKISDPERLLSGATGLADGYFDSMRALASDPAEMGRQLLFGAVRLVVNMSAMVFIYRGLGQTAAGYWQIIAMSCWQFTSAGYVPLPGASGAQEGLFGLYYRALLPGSLLLSGLLAWRFVTYYLVLIVGFIVTAALGMGNKSINEAKAEIGSDHSC